MRNETNMTVDEMKSLGTKAKQLLQTTESKLRASVDSQNLTFYINGESITPEPGSFKGSNQTFSCSAGQVVKESVCGKHFVISLGQRYNIYSHVDVR